METEEERRIRRKRRIEEMKRIKRRTELLYKWGIPAIAAFVILVGSSIGIGAAVNSRDDIPGQEADGRPPQTEQSAGPEGDDAEGNGTGNIAWNGGTVEGPGTVAGPEGDDAEGNGTGNIAWNGGNVEAPGTVAGPEGDDAEGNGTGNIAWNGGTVEGPGTVAGPANVEGPGTGTESEPSPSRQAFEAHSTAVTAGFSENVMSQYGIFIDVEEGAILAQKNAKARMNPASMTKILTVLVAAEHITEADLEDRVTITRDITDYCYVNECSITGYDLDEKVTVRDLFYGTILPSGADSALALATYVAGSHEAFMDLMNEKLEGLGLSETSHFTNCVGLYDEEHYSTAYDMAMILKAAADNDFCREVLSAHSYTTSLTDQHPEGLLISNWFLRRIEDRDTHGEVLCAKTGYVAEAGSCAASLGVGSDGREYLCVTAGSDSSWDCIADHVTLYQRFLPALPATDD